MKLALWLVLIGASTVLGFIVAGICHKKVTGEREPRWYYNLTRRQKALVTTTRTACTLFWFIVFFSPVYIEFPNLIGNPVVATIESGKLVYHPWGIFDPPWKWSKQTVVNAYSDDEFGCDLHGVSKEKRNIVGEYSLQTHWKIINIETWYTHTENTVFAVRKELLRHLVDLQPSLAEQDLSIEANRKQLCDSLIERFTEDGNRRGIAITDCYFSFRDYE